MAYVGNPIDTQNTFQSLQGKRFSGDGSTTAFTLDVAPSNVLDIEVFVGNVRQDPNSAYTLSGTTLTFTGAPPSGTNNIYVVHQAKSVGTIDVPASGVQAGSLASTVLTGQTDIGAGIADADLFLVDDGAGGTLRKTAASRLKTYIPDNTPAFHAYMSSNQSISNGTNTKIAFNSERIDTDSAFDTTNNRFVVPSGGAGKYVFTYWVKMAVDDGKIVQLILYKNGSELSGEETRANFFSSASNQSITSLMSFVDTASASDYYEVFIYQNNGSSANALQESSGFMGFKLAGA